MLSHENIVLGAAHSEDFAILAFTILIQLTSVSDRQTDGQTDV